MNLHPGSFIPVCRLRGHGTDVTRGRISSDSTTAATSSAEKLVILWDAASGLATRSLSQTHEVTDVAFHGSGMGLITSCLDGIIRVFDLRSGSSAPVLSLSSNARPNGDFAEFSCLAVGSSVNSPFIAGGTTMGQIYCFDMRKSALSCSMFAHYNTVCSLEVADNGETFISSSLDGSIRLWSALRGDCLMTVTDGTSNTSACVYANYVKKDEEFIGLFLDSTIRRWTTRDRIHCQQKVTGPKMVNSTKTFSKTSNDSIAVPSEDGYVHFLSLDGKPCQSPVKAHADDVLSVDVRGDLMISTAGGEDSSAVLWLRANSDSEAARIKGVDYGVTYSLVSPQIEGLV
jgi:WD40 repeat protein